MKAIAYYPLHYGREWLYWSLRAVLQAVDEVIILYTKTPSFGKLTSVECPDSQQQLHNIADQFDDVSFYTYVSQHGDEGKHRTVAENMCKRAGADVIVAVDADEIWDPVNLRNTIEFAVDYGASTYRVPFRHFWRSAHWLCDDGALPLRITNVNGNGGDLHMTPMFGYVNHFGYAVSLAIMRYKWLIHGHLDELREGWLDNTFRKFGPNQQDVHPTNVNYWNARQFDITELQHLIGDHPYFHEGVIGDDVIDSIDSGDVMLPGFGAIS